MSSPLLMENVNVDNWCKPQGLKSQESVMIVMKTLVFLSLASQLVTDIRRP